MDNRYIRGLRIQKRSVIKRLYAAICMLLVSSLLMSVSSYAWFALSSAPEVSGVTTTVGANGSLEIALNANDLDADTFTVSETSSVGINSLYEKNTLWGNIIDLSDEHYGLQDVELKPTALNYADEGKTTLNPTSPIAFARYGEDGRIILVDSVCGLTSYNQYSSSFLPASHYGVRMSAEQTATANEPPMVLALQELYSEFVDTLLSSGLLDDLWAQSYGFDPNARISDVIDLDTDLLSKLRGADRFSERTESGLLYRLDQVLTQAEEDYLKSGADSLQGSGLDEQRALLNQVIADADACAALCAELTKDAAPDDNLPKSEFGNVLEYFCDSEHSYSNGGRGNNEYYYIEFYAGNEGLLYPVFKLLYTSREDMVRLGGSTYYYKFEITSRNEILEALNIPPYAYSTYAFGIDLLFRTNAIDANLLLQTMGIDRVYNNDNAPDRWIASDDYESYQGRGSWIMMGNPDLLAALRVAFVDTVTGQIYGMAKADQDGWLHLINDENSAIIRSLDTHVITPITVWVYLDGDLVQNAHVGSVNCTDLEINLQFSTDTVLYPAYSGDNETPNMPFEPSIPSEPSTPDTPDAPAPSIPTEQTEFYLEHDGGDQYSFYTLKQDGSREYEMTFSGSVNEEAQTVTVEDVTEYPDGGVIIPALATYSANDAEYAVSIDPTAPFADLRSENAAIFIVPVDGEKVGVTSADLSRMFAQNMYTDFISLDLSGLDTSNVTSMSCMFRYCYNLKTLDVSGLDTSNVTDMSQMFYDCNGLTSLNLSGFDTSSVTGMDWMFYNCNSLTELNVSGFDTSKVTGMSSMFYCCSGLTELDISGFDTSNVTYMYSMLSGCSGLQTIVTPKALGDVGIDLPGSYLCEADGNTYTVLDKSVPTQAVMTKSAGENVDDGTGILGEWGNERNDLSIVFYSDGTASISDLTEEPELTATWEHNSSSKSYFIVAQVEDQPAIFETTIQYNEKDPSIAYITIDGDRYFRGIGKDERVVTVISNGMSPLMNEGDTILCQKVENPETLSVGDIISFWTVIDGQVVVHTSRINEIYDAGGFLVFETKDDNSATPNPLTVHQSDVIGTFIKVLF